MILSFYENFFEISLRRQLLLLVRTMRVFDRVGAEGIDLGIILIKVERGQRLAPYDWW